MEKFSIAEMDILVNVYNELQRTLSRRTPTVSKLMVEGHPNHRLWLAFCYMEEWLIDNHSHGEWARPRAGGIYRVRSAARLLTEWLAQHEDYASTGRDNG